MKMKVISNTGPIIGLSTIGRLDLLWKLFDVYIPQEVYREIVKASGEGAIGKKELSDAVSKGFIHVHTVKDEEFIKKAYGRLHRGELEVIVGAREIDTDIVIIDERSARNFAETLMLKPLGTLGILKLSKVKGHISEAKPLLDLLVKNKYRISDHLIKRFLYEIGE